MIDGPPYEIRHVSGGPSGTPPYGNSIALQQLARQELNDISFSVESTGGGGIGPKQFGTCQAQSGYLSATQLYDRDPSKRQKWEVTCEPRECFRSFSAVTYLFAVTEQFDSIDGPNDTIKTDDLDGKSVYTIAQDTPIRDGLQQTTDAEVVNFPIPELAGEVSRGNIDALVAAHVWTGDSEETALIDPQWRQIHQTVGLTPVEFTDEFKCVMNEGGNFGGAGRTKLYGGWPGKLDKMEIDAQVSASGINFLASHTVPEDVIYDLMTAMRKRADDFAEATMLHVDPNNLERLAEGMASPHLPDTERVQMHPGAVKFYDEHGIDPANHTYDLVTSEGLDC
jgi:TRAP-type uncharacterized transport system substrate-binding protein